MKKVIFLFALVLVLGGCVKKTIYPEGGEFRGNAMSAVLGTYTLQRYLVDGADSTDYYNNVCGRTEYRFFNPNPKFSEFWFEISFFDKNIVSYPGIDSVLAGTFELFNEDKDILLRTNRVILFFGIGPIIQSGSVRMCNIKKLTSDSFIIETDLFNNHYRMEFIKK